MDTRDHEDHTFNGVLFNLEIVNTLPIDFVEIQSIWVRGGLGLMTVHVTPVTWRGKAASADLWQKCFEKDLAPSFQEFVEMGIHPPIRLAPGMSLGIYVHSQRRDDRGLVYDEQKSHITYENEYIRLYPGLAHISSIPFDPVGPWRHAYRDRREFVGRFTYGVKQLLWHPNHHFKFSPTFRNSVMTMVTAQYRKGNLLRKLPHMVLFYILNMLPWDWFGEELGPVDRNNKPIKKSDDDSDEDGSRRSKRRKAAQARSVALRALRAGVNVPEAIFAMLNRRAEVGSDEETDDDEAFLVNYLTDGVFSSKPPGDVEFGAEGSGFEMEEQMQILESFKTDYAKFSRKKKKDEWGNELSEYETESEEEEDADDVKKMEEEEVVQEEEEEEERAPSTLEEENIKKAEESADSDASEW